MSSSISQMSSNVAITSSEMRESLILYFHQQGSDRCVRSGTKLNGTKRVFLITNNDRPEIQLANRDLRVDPRGPARTRFIVCAPLIHRIRFFVV